MSFPSQMCIRDRPSLYEGFFLAPNVVSGALKGAIFAANVYERLGFRVVPKDVYKRQDLDQLDKGRNDQNEDDRLHIGKVYLAREQETVSYTHLDVYKRQAEVFQKGFKVGEKVVRFAMVKVAN